MPDRCARQKAFNSSGVAVASPVSTTAAAGTKPFTWCGIATTQASLTAGCENRMFSTSFG